MAASTTSEATPTTGRGPAPAPRTGTLSGALRVAEREVRVYARLWRAQIGTAIVTPLLFLGALGIGLGGIIDENGPTAAGTASRYLQFITPGLLAATVFQNAANGSLWPVIGGTTWMRTFHGMVSTPITAQEVYVGFLLHTAAFRGLVTATPFLIVATLLGGVASPATAILALPAAILGGLAVAAPLMAYSVTLESDAPASLISRLGVMPLFLFSGGFFPVEQLPDGLQVAALLSPLYHSTELARAATLGASADLPVVVHLAALLAVIAAGTAVAWRTFPRRLTP